MGRKCLEIIYLFQAIFSLYSMIFLFWDKTVVILNGCALHGMNIFRQHDK